jgi:hypothetical protein
MGRTICNNVSHVSKLFLKRMTWVWMGEVESMSRGEPQLGNLEPCVSRARLSSDWSATFIYSPLISSGSIYGAPTMCVRFWIRHWGQWVEQSLLDFVLPESKGPVLSSVQFSSVQFSSVAQSCRTLCNPMNCSTPGFPVHHQLLESTQTHVHWVGDAIQSSHPLSFPSPAFNHSQHQGLFQWVSSSHQVAKVLEFQLQHQSFQWTPRTDLL